MYLVDPRISSDPHDFRMFSNPMNFPVLLRFHIENEKKILFRLRPSSAVNFFSGGPVSHLPRVFRG